MNPRQITSFVRVNAYTVGMSFYAILRQQFGRDPELFRRHTRQWARRCLELAEIEVRIEGGDGLDPSASYVFMANHQSHCDIPSLFAALPMVPGFLAKAELRRVPFFGRAMEVGGHVFVDRRKHTQAVDAIGAAARDLRDGRSIVIFPEGTRSRRREVLPFKKGGFHLVKQAGVPLVPIGLRGTADVLPKHGRTIRPGRVHVVIGEPIPAERVGDQSLEALIREVRSHIASLSELPLALDRSGARR